MKSLPGGGEFDHQGWVFLIASVDFITWVDKSGVKAAETNFDEYKRKDYVFVADWLKPKAYISFVPHLKLFKNHLYYL